MGRLGITIVGITLACGGLDQGGPTTSSNVAGSSSVSAAGSHATPSFGGSNAGTPNTQSAGNLGVTLSLGGSSVMEPQHARDCILERLRAAESGEIGPGAGGASSFDSAHSMDDAQAGSAGDSAVDLELGTGDLTVLAIFDKSGSMGTGWDGRSRWQVANEAWLKAIEGVLDNLTLATLFFPQVGGCDVAPLDSDLQVEFMPGAQFYANWIAMAESRAPDGSTPLEQAFVAADHAIEQACHLGLLRDRFRVVLVTDGEPTCNDDPERIVHLAREWHRIGVETWVMGLPGSATAAALLDAIAEVGGTDKHQSLGTPSELDDGLHAAAR